MNNPDEGATGTFWEHLDALRDCLLKALAVTVVCALVAFFFKESLFRVVLAPKEAGFVTYRLMGDIGQFLGALYAGVFCASPYLLYLLFRFVSPALYTHERRYAVRTVGAGYLMFLSGAALNYFLIFPLTFRFLGTYQVSAEVENTITLESYMDTLLMMTLTMGIVFEIPILCWLLARLGFLTASFMRRYRRHAIVLILVAAAVITPTSDVFTLLLVGMPMWMLYEAGIYLVALTEKRR